MRGTCVGPALPMLMLLSFPVPGLEHALGIATAPVPMPERVPAPVLVLVVVVALSGTGL
jgi:hypothetical protein